MALAIVQTVIAENISAAALTTASYNITAGNNCVLLSASNGDGPATTHTISGTPAFTQQAIRNLADAGQEGAASCHTHMNSAGHTGVTTTNTTNLDPAFGGISMTITELSGGEASFTGAVGENSNNSGTPSVTFTINGPASYVFGTASDWAASGDFTAGTGETLLNTHHDGARYSAGQWHSTSTQGAGSYTSDGAGSATRDYNIVAIEMRDGVTTVPDPGHRRRALPPNMRSGPREFRAFVQGEGLLEEVTMDKWYAPASEPVPQLLEVVAY